jgi:hypothetical protein
MIINQPNDGRGLLYHLVDLLGQTVHAYRDFDAAFRCREGDQRIAIQIEGGRWLTNPPAPVSQLSLGPEARRLLPDQVQNLTSGLYLSEHRSLKDYDLAVADAVQDVIFGPEVRGHYRHCGATFEQDVFLHHNETSCPHCGGAVKPYMTTDVSKP